MNEPRSNRPEAGGENEPHLPFFRSWRGVYGLVLFCFVLYVALLALLSRAFS